MVVRLFVLLPRGRTCPWTDYLRAKQVVDALPTLYPTIIIMVERSSESIPFYRWQSKQVVDMLVIIYLRVDDQYSFYFTGGEEIPLDYLRAKQVLDKLIASEGAEKSFLGSYKGAAGSWEKVVRAYEYNRE